MPGDSICHEKFVSWSPGMKKTLYTIGPGVYYTMNADGSNIHVALEFKWPENKGSLQLCKVFFRQHIDFH
jgi:hypothetical protein